MPHGTGEEHSPLAGQLLADRYRLDAPIESGHMGEVWSARDTVLNRPVAVRVINQAHAADEAFVSRFRTESRYAAALSHSGVAQVFDYGEQESTSPPCPYLVMEHVSGRQLSELIAQAGPLPVDLVLDITAQAARALQAAHDIGITHRDIKSANLLITDDGLVKITDFGIAAVKPVSQVTTVANAELVHAAAYMSPEQAEGKPATQGSDIYSLGVVAYECVSGRLPFSGRTPLALAAARAEGEPPPLPGGVPAPVRDLIMRMIAKDPWQRPGTALAVAETASALRKQMLSSAGKQAARWTGRQPAAGTPQQPAVRTGRDLARMALPQPAGRTGRQLARMAASQPAERTGSLPARTTGPQPPGSTARVAGESGTDAATITAPQPSVQGGRKGTSRHRRRRAVTVAAVAVGVTALCGAIAAMMLGGKPPTSTPPPARHTPGPGVQAVVPALGPTAHPRKKHARPKPRAAASRSKTAAPGRPGTAPAPAPPPRRPASSPPAGSPSHSPSPAPSASPTPSQSPTPTTPPS